MIIFLNGASSSGKSTLAREIMHQSDRPFLYYSVDHLVNFWIDEKFVVFADERKEWFYHQQSLDEEGNLQTNIVDGPNAIQLHWDMIDALLVLIKKGYDLIIDEVLWSPDIFERYVHALCHADKVYMVKIQCELMECERREKEREDRFVGMARGLYANVYHEPPYYDLVVDSTYTAPEVLAREVLNAIENHPKPEAFSRTLSTIISFEPLKKDHFPLILEWLNTPHVAKWWSLEGKEKGAAVSLPEIEKKYAPYLGKNEIQSYIIHCAKKPIGYIQFYNAYKFAREGYAMKDLPKSLAALDFYIGDSHYGNKGLAAPILEQFLAQFVWPYFEACFVDPDSHNEKAVKAYQRAGFEVVKDLKEPPVIWMLKSR